MARLFTSGAEWNDFRAEPTTLTPLEKFCVHHVHRHQFIAFASFGDGAR